MPKSQVMELPAIEILELVSGVKKSEFYFIVGMLLEKLHYCHLDDPENDLV
jgi:hypothetical protein